ncbi:MAG: flippase-like domain-containing protein [SAR324 cluster bacterium]|nr:flippase-like domain-containing protein [SAR324 cluster bacterium]
MKKLFITLIKLGLVGGILYYLIASDRLNPERMKLFWEKPLIPCLIFLGTVLFMIPLASYRWFLLLKAVGLKVDYTRAFLLTWIGMFFNVSLPGAVSGDVVKGYYIIKAQQNEGKAKAFTTLLIDRFVGLFGLIVMAFLALLFNWQLIAHNAALHSMVVMIVILFIGTLLFYAIVLFPFRNKDPFLLLFSKLPASHLTTKVYSAFKLYEHRKWTLLSTLLMSILIHSIIAMFFFQMASLLEVQNLKLATQLFIMPIGLITVAIPIAPGGVGVGHAAFESLYHMVGISGGADIFNLYVIIQLLVCLLGGIPYFTLNHENHVTAEDIAALQE